MDSTMTLLVFGVIMVALVALGRPVRGRWKGSEVEIATPDENDNQ